MFALLLLCLTVQGAPEGFSVVQLSNADFDGGFAFQLLHDGKHTDVGTPQLTQGQKSEDFFLLEMDLQTLGKMEINVTQDKNTYFVWTNMHFVGKDIKASDAPKFMTRLKGKYVCNSVIDIPMSQNYTFQMSNAAFRAFYGDAAQPIYTEVCPRDVKVSAPAAAIAGSVIGIVIIGIFVAFGGVQCHKHIKNKKAKKASEEN